MNEVLRVNRFLTCISTGKSLKCFADIFRLNKYFEYYILLPKNQSVTRLGNFPGEGLC